MVNLFVISVFTLIYLVTFFICIAWLIEANTDTLYEEEDLINDDLEDEDIHNKYF
jgi:hypothetical protein